MLFTFYFWSKNVMIQKSLRVKIEAALIES